MSTPMPTGPALASAAANPDRPRAATHRAWWREPLLHFLLIGAVLFAIDHVLAGRADDPRTIVISAQVEQETKALLRSARGREPNADELRALRQAWLDNEVLYREGLAMQMDRGDTAIRERVIFKALSMVDANVKAPQADDKTLRAWFEAHRGQYDEPARYDFQEAVLAGENTESAVKAFVELLNRGMPGELNAGLRVFKGRPHQNLVDSYGEAFARSLEAAPAGEWRAHATRDGWRAMRLEASTAARPAQFEPLRGVVLHDWVDAVMAEQRTQAVRALAGKYTVQVEAP